VEILERYVGEYALAPGVTLLVTLEAGLLRIAPTGQQQLVLGAESEDRFHVRGVAAEITFLKDPTGRVTSLVLRQNGGQQVAPKVK
ncbi:MAG: DUF3471 domain-containing protein, partial [Gemmatimonadales bacterium]|nr:DUF3471 domain-containing protein [Gemmatimonadales bacterium]